MSKLGEFSAPSAVVFPAFGKEAILTLGSRHRSPDIHGMWGHHLAKRHRGLKPQWSSRWGGASSQACAVVPGAQARCRWVQALAQHRPVPQSPACACSVVVEAFVVNIRGAADPDKDGLVQVGGVQGGTDWPSGMQVAPQLQRAPRLR